MYKFDVRRRINCAIGFYTILSTYYLYLQIWEIVILSKYIMLRYFFLAN